MRHEFIYNGMNSRDYGLKISGEDTWTRPQPDVKRISVPGRNGDLIQLGNRYQNLDITYHCGIVKDLRTNFDAFNARLLSEPGYHRLEDSYHPEYYRLAVFESDREYTRFADDQPLEEEITFRIDIYARENLLYPINAALHKTMRRNGYQRYGQVQDDYLQDMDIYVKSATYTIKEQFPFPWE